MRAAVLQAVGRPLEVLELELDLPRQGEVEVRMLASGVCHSDVHRADGDWGSVRPTVLGHEGAGVVEALGGGVDGLERGQLVVLSWFPSCRRCSACTARRPWECSGTSANDHLQQDGTTRIHTSDGEDVLAYLSIGTFAEREVVAAVAAVPVPRDVPPEVAALIGCCVATGVGAVRNTARVPAGVPVAIVGLGGVGLSAVMGGALVGASPIVAVDRDPAKLQLASRAGASEGVLATSDHEETLRNIIQATGGGPAFAFETAGFASTADLCLRSLPTGGTAVLVGLPPFGDRASVELFDFVDGSRRILGSNYGWSVPDRDFPLLAEHYLAGRLPIDLLVEERIALDDVERAMDALRRGEGARRVILFE
jgi:S-(hydroxymethyl)glutathione dehydrogenase/alcohol dehydrogenase